MSLSEAGPGHRDQSGPPAWAQGPLSTGVGGWCDVGVCVHMCVGGDGGEEWGGLHTGCTPVTQPQPLNGNVIVSPPLACPLKHGLDMETTCICIHVTAGPTSPSQPQPITERLHFSSCAS